MGADRAVARQRDRVLGAVDQLRGPLELLGARLWLDGGGVAQRRGIQGKRHHVLGQLEVGGSGLLGLCDLERLADDLGDDLGARDPGVPLDDRAQDADQIEVLV